MLDIIISDSEIFDDDKEEFVVVKGGNFTIEHSLLSISKWEAKWKIPFFKDGERTLEQTLDYIKCMTITPKVDESLYYKLTNDDFAKIDEYIHDPMTATTFNEIEENNGSIGKRGRVITSELIYYYMIAYQIPQEYQKWHINRLMTLIKICNIENQPPKKMSRSELNKRNRALNAARRKKFHSNG